MSHSYLSDFDNKLQMLENFFTAKFHAKTPLKVSVCVFRILDAPVLRESLEIHYVIYKP